MTKKLRELLREDILKSYFKNRKKKPGVKVRDGKRIEGYWKTNTEIYPLPIPNILQEDEVKIIYKLIKEKEKLAEKHSYRGCSGSRITGEVLGNKEYETDKWIWPGDFAFHYVLKHKVKPSDDFLEYIGYYK